MPALESIIRRIQEVKLFSGLSRSQLRDLAGLVHEVEYEGGHTICQQGEPGHRYFIVEEGALRVTRLDPQGQVSEVQRLGPGAAFGETSLMLGDVRDATVETLQRTVLLCVEREEFDDLLEEDPLIEQALRMRPDVAERRRYPRFSWLEEGEIPVKVVRKHPIVLVEALAVVGIFFLVLLAAGLLLGLRGPLALAGGGIAALALLARCAYAYMDWRNDVYAVTNRRVVHWERVGLVREHFSGAPLHAIQDVQELRIGIRAHVWNFGDLTIETAGGAGRVVFRSIPNPGKVCSIIFEQRERARALARTQERAAIREVVRREFLHETEAKEQEASTEEPEPARRSGCLLVLVQVARYFLPRSWHREGETVTWRKHWVALIRLVGLPVVAFAVVTILVLVYIAVAEMGGQPGFWVSVFAAYVGATLLLVPWVLWHFEDWQNDFYRVTATRLIHVERLPFYLREERREAHLEQITNVRSEQSFLGRFLRYGDVIVETAAPAGTFHLRKVSQPQRVQSEIFSHIEASRQRQRERQAERQRAELLDWLSAYDEMRRSGTPSDEGSKESD